MVYQSKGGHWVFSITWLILVVDLADDGTNWSQFLSPVWQGKQARWIWLGDKLAELVVGDASLCCDWPVLAPSDKDKENRSSSFYMVSITRAIVNFTQDLLMASKHFCDYIISGQVAFWWSLANFICDWLIIIGIFAQSSKFHFCCYLECFLFFLWDYWANIECIAFLWAFNRAKLAPDCH